jgi:hypothetical protein
MTDRLYGKPQAESLYTSLDLAIDAAIDDLYDTPGVREVIIEEWTVHPPQHHLPDAEQIVDWVIEWAADSGEVAEGWGEDLWADDPDLLVAAEALRDAIADKVGFRMADRMIARHTATFTLDEHRIPTTTDVRREEVQP